MKQDSIVKERIANALLVLALVLGAASIPLHSFETGTAAAICAAVAFILC